MVLIKLIIGKMENKMNNKLFRNKMRKITSSLLRSPTKWVQLWVTERCNLACVYCGSYNNTSQDPSLEILVERVKKLNKLGVGMISLYGGEPSIRRDLPELISYINELGSVSYIATNGTFDRVYLQRLGEAGIDVIHLSADYFDKTGALRERGKKYLNPNKLQMFLEGREEFGYLLWLNICVTTQNKNDVERLLKIAKDNEIYTVIRPAVKDREPLNLLNIIDATFPDFSDIIELANYCIERRNEIPLSSPVEYFHELIRYANGKPLTWKCGSGKLFFGVNIHGDIIPCSEIYTPTKVNLDALDLGSLDESVLKNVREEIVRKFLPECNHRCIQATPFCTTHYTYNTNDAMYVMKNMLGNQG